jgi:hypothetical protein
MQIFIGFRARHRKLLPEHIKGRIGLVRIEDKRSFLRHGWQFPFDATARLAPSRTGFDPVFIAFLLCGLVDGRVSDLYFASSER